MTFSALRILPKESDLIPVRLLGEWSDSLLAKFPVNQKLKLILDNSAGWTGGGLRFLKKIQELHAVDILGHCAVYDIWLPSTVRSLRIGVPLKESVDFSCLPNLEELVINFSQYTKSFLEVSSLKSLLIQNLRMSNFESFAKLSNLEVLDVQGSLLTSFAGISHLKELNTLHVCYSPKLVDISEISFCQKLSQIEFVNCKKIGNYAPLGALPSLAELTLERCGEIETVRIFEDNDVIRVLHISGTKIIDGEFSGLLNCKKLAYFFFEEKKHFSHSRRSWHELKFPNAIWPKTL